MTKFEFHWPEYLMEAFGLGAFMVSACLFATLLEYPNSSVYRAISDPLIRRMLMGGAMGLTAVGVIYSPWGKQSGAHLNPALTLTFWGLGKIKTGDAVFYIIFQFIGGLTGVLLTHILLGISLADPPVSYVVTVPGTYGTGVALFSELLISFGLMMMVLITTNNLRLQKFTGLFAGLMLFIYITIEAPFSGMSLNPARTVASAIPAMNWDGIWVYFLGPLAGMILAAFVYVEWASRDKVLCAKLNHQTKRRCIFNCRYKESVISKEMEIDNLKGD